jgi:uncharacterized Rmd1/YagE family protein
MRNRTSLPYAVLDTPEHFWSAPDHQQVRLDQNVSLA